MQILCNTNEQSLTLKITVKVIRPEVICIRVVDAQNIPGTNRPVAVYEDRYQKVLGTDTFFVKMPVSPKQALVQVYTQRKGNVADGVDKSFKWTMKVVPLERSIMPLYIPQKKAREFMLFAQDFAKNKNIISAGYWGSPKSIYRSHDGALQIDYYDVLLDVRPQIYSPVFAKQVPNPGYMKPVTTPMRRQIDTGIIEVSKMYTADYTVPETIAVLAHEFAHLDVNGRPSDEEEADRHAAIIVLESGYGKIPAYRGFLKVFRNADNPMNRMREEKLYNFIEKYQVGSHLLIA